MSSFSDLASKIHGITTVVGGASVCLVGVRERLVEVREAPTTEDIDGLIAELDADATSLAAAIANVPALTPAPAAGSQPASTASATDGSTPTATGTGTVAPSAAPAVAAVDPSLAASGTGTSGNAGSAA